MLFQKQESQHRMGPDSNKTRHPPFKHPPESLMLRNIRNKLNNTLMVLITHDSRLNNIDRRTYRCSHEAR